MNDSINPALSAILTQLWLAHQTARDSTWSLAKLAKQTHLAMSSLRRQLTVLSDAGLVCLTLTDLGTGSVRLSDDGVSLCRAMYQPDNKKPPCTQAQDG